MRFSSAAAPVLGALVLLTPLSAQKKPITLKGLMDATGNSLTTLMSNFMDITVKAKNGIVVTNMEVNCENTRQGGVGTKFAIEVYVTKRGGTYVGNERMAAAWGLVGKGDGVSKARGTPTPIDISDFYLPAGKYGLAVHYTPRAGTRTAVAYTNGNATNSQFKDANIQLDLGTANSGKFTGGVFRPRIWNGSFTYYVSGLGTAAFGTHAPGCSGGGPGGAPTLTPGAKSPVPKLGGKLDLVVGNLPKSVTLGFLIVGLNFQQWGPSKLPTDLKLIGMPGCLTQVSPDILLNFIHVGTGTSTTVTLPVPKNAGLSGLTLGFHVLVVNKAATNGAGAQITGLAGGFLGN